MATVTGFTAERMQEIEDNAIVDGDVVAGNLILTRHDGSQINAGSVIGPQGVSGPTAGLPAGGATGEALVKINGTDYNTQWKKIIHVGTVAPVGPVVDQLWVDTA